MDKGWIKPNTEDIGQLNELLEMSISIQIDELREKLERIKTILEIVIDHNSTK